jgi:hypothetical protein
MGEGRVREREEGRKVAIWLVQLSSSPGQVARATTMLITSSAGREARAAAKWGPPAGPVYQ